MIPLRKNNSISSNDIKNLIQTHHGSLMQAFYESQSVFLCGIYKQYKSIETATILLCFSRNIHLQIIRQREKDLNFNVSLENFTKNLNVINKLPEKITSIVQITSIPKETVRRKIKNLADAGFLTKDKKNKGFHWSLPEDRREAFFVNINQETKNLSVFISKIVNDLNIKLNSKIIEDEICSQFSFYWYHYLSCQLEWLKWWQSKLKDNDLLLIALQAVMPTLQYIDKNLSDVNFNNLFKNIGKVKKNCTNCSVNPSSVSDITGIPRATCIRKLEKLVNLGFLTREEETKRYSVNQSTDARTKNILSRDNVNFTLNTFSEYIAIILNSLIHNKL